MWISLFSARGYESLLSMLRSAPARKKTQRRDYDVEDGPGQSIDESASVLGENAA